MGLCARDAWLDGSTNYVLNVPANVPAAEFWSLTVYDVATRAPIKNKQIVADKSSRMDLDVNEDASVKLYVGPDAREAGTQNWIPIAPGKAWFPYFRFYSPTEAYFDRSWVLPDIQKATKARFEHSLRLVSIRTMQGISGGRGLRFNDSYLHITTVCRNRNGEQAIVAHPVNF